MNVTVHIGRLLTAVLISAGVFCMTEIPQASAQKKSKAKTAKAVKPKTDLKELIGNAEQAFYDYQFDKAIEILDEYESNLDKSGTEPDKRYDDLRRRSELGSTMLGRVEKIAIIDSLIVDKNDFFNAYKLSDPTGYIVENSSLPEELATSGNPTVYISESGETMLWSGLKPDGGRQLVSSHLLTDNAWESPQPLGDALNDIVDAAYPFLMADGSTLYFAGKGDESLGGYDIFISRNNGEEFLQPQNMGMPYNSPYDDYLLVIDELTGAGWWATDRNRIDGKVTIYIFVPQELRVNYPAEAPELIDRAKITSIAATRKNDTDYGKIEKAISDLDNETPQKEREFQFAMPGGKIYERMADFHNEQAVEAMKRYLDAQFELTMEEDALAGMRIELANGIDNRNEILSAEKRIEKLRRDVANRANEVVKAETGK